MELFFLSLRIAELELRYQRMNITVVGAKIFFFADLLDDHAHPQIIFNERTLIFFQLLRRLSNLL